jgi:DNA-binding MarR family transcriptional regulator
MDDHGTFADGAPPAGSLDAGLGFRLGRVHRSLRQDWERRLHDLQLTPPQAAALRAVRENPGTGLRELARLIRTDAMNARRLAERLEHLGLVTASADPAHRQRRIVRPTPLGLSVAHEVVARSEAWNTHIERLMGTAEYTRLQHALTRLETLLATETHGTDPDDTDAADTEAGEQS